MIGTISFETLVAMNSEFFDGRWGAEDLRELITPRFGVISDIQGLNRSLSTIRSRDLGEIPPAFIENGLHP